jgi:hypothetical protein
LGIALLWLIWPPDKRPSKAILWILAIFAVVSLVTLALTDAPSWREALA